MNTLPAFKFNYYSNWILYGSEICALLTFFDIFDHAWPSMTSKIKTKSLNLSYKHENFDLLLVNDCFIWIEQENNIFSLIILEYWGVNFWVQLCFWYSISLSGSKRRSGPSWNPILKILRKFLKLSSRMRKKILRRPGEKTRPVYKIPHA